MKSPAVTPDREAGFTLVELLVGITLMLLVLAAGFTLLQVVIRTEPAIQDSNTSIQQGQIAAERMARELRQTYDVNSASANSLSVDTYIQTASNCSGGAGTTAVQCRVVYSCTANSCTRTVSEVNGANASTATVITGLASTNVFTYSPSSTSPTSISLTLNLSGQSSDDAITVSDGVALRNVTGAVGT